MKKKAKILSVVNRRGVVFNVGDTAYFMGREFKTDLTTTNLRQ